MSKESSNSNGNVEASTNDYLGEDLKRRTFAKGAGASLALASSLGAMGTGAAETHDNGLGDDSPGNDDSPDMGLDNQFRQMDKELYVAALAANQDENGDLSEDESQNGGSGIAVFEAPEGRPDDVGVDDDDGPGASDDAPGTGDDGPGANGHEVDSLDYHVFIMDADNVGRVTLNDNTTDEEVEELADLSLDDDDEMSPDDDDDMDPDDDDEMSPDDDDNGNGADDDMGQGVSGTIEEPIVVAGSLGQGAMDDGPGADESGVDDNDEPGVDDNDNPAQGNGEFDLEDFRRNPWNYYVAVHGDDADDDDDNGLGDDDDNGLGDDDDNGLGDDNGDSEAMLRGRVTTGLLEGEEEPGDRVSDDDDDDGVGDDNGIGDDDDGVGDDDDGVGDDDDGVGDDDDGVGDDDDGGLFD